MDYVFTAVSLHGVFGLHVKVKSKKKKKYEDIPETWEGKPVISADNLFEGCTNITSLPLLPSSVITAKSFAAYSGVQSVPVDYFSHNTHLENLMGAFAATAIEKAPALPPSMTSSAHSVRGMFMGCKNLTDASAFAPNQGVNCTNAFMNCENLIIPPKKIYGNSSFNIFLGCDNIEFRPNIFGDCDVSSLF